MDAPSLASPMQAAAPHPALAAHVRSYLQIQGHGGGTIQVAALHAPLLLLTWGAPVRIRTVASGERPLPLVVLFGPTTQVHHSEIGAGACGFHVRFSPTGARALLGERLGSDQWDDGLPADVRAWAEAIAEAPGFEARVALADAFLRSRVPAHGLWSASAASLVSAVAGAAPVAAVADALGVSGRTLRRRFRDDVGIGVKTFAQIERYRQSHGLLLRTPGATWRDVCERFGYADQAHFVRSFRRFAGASPTRWRPDEHAFDLGFGLRDEGVRHRLSGSFKTPDARRA